METLELDDLQNGYVKLVEHVVKHGREARPRGMRTAEVRDLVVTLRDPTKAVPVGVGRGVNERIGAGEAACLIAGVADAGLMVNATKNFAMFVEHDRLYGAYGPRVFRQLPEVVRTLVSDPDSRQAGVTIYQPLDGEVPTKDVPCTLSLWYQVRDGRLHASTVMRSQDMVWGVTYDYWMFTHLQRVLAWVLGLPVGEYVHHAHSAHVYVDRDEEIIAGLHGFDGTESQPPAPVPDDYRHRLRGESAALQRLDYARLAMEGALGLRPWARNHARMGEGAEYYRTTLEPEWSGRSLCGMCRQMVPAEWIHKSGGFTGCAFCDRDRRYRQPVGTTFRLMLAQRGKCAICQKPGHIGPGDGDQLCVDHCHETGRVRGLLCSHCNRGIGHIKEPDALSNAAEYVGGSGTDFAGLTALLA